MKNSEKKGSADRHNDAAGCGAKWQPGAAVLRECSRGRLRSNELVAVAVLVAGLLMAQGEAVAQTIRSSYYDGFSDARYQARPEYDPSVAMTIEAWVYREDASRCEAIVSHGRSDSYWFGFCGGRLRFYRSGGTFVEAFSAASVPAYQWTHVAVNYTGSVAAFYIDGTAAGNFTLGNAGAGRTKWLHIGNDPDGTTPFLGYIDELRIWSESRNRLVVEDGMYQELRSGNLIGAWGRGAGTELVHGFLQVPAFPAPPRVFGMLPRDLVIPRPAIPITMDGQINADSEYAGAEQLVMRYRKTGGVPYAPDAVAYLVHDDENLYVAFGPPRPFYGGTPAPYVGLFLDRDYDRVPGLAGAMIHTPLAPGASSWRVPDLGLGDFRACAGGECPPAGSWQVVKGTCGDDVGPPCMEQRISRALLGDWNEVDGLAIGHFDVSPSGDLYMAPPQSHWFIESSWASAYYSDGSAVLPRGRISGHVYDGVSPDRSRPLAGVQVTFGGRSGGPRYAQITDVNGAYSFDVPVPIDSDLSIAIDQCNFCRQTTPLIGAQGIPPTTIAPHLVAFPGCATGACDYASVDFFSIQPIPPTTLANISPGSGAPPFLVRTGASPLVTPGTGMTFTGTNFHDALIVSLARDNGDPDPAQWLAFPATINSISPDRTTMQFTIPPILDEPGTWRWIIHDEWPRPGYEEWIISAPYNLIEPDYGSLHGFGFTNHDDDASLDEFYGVFGSNARICIGAFGICIHCVPDPLYLLYYELVYERWINDSGGSCMGMSATSLMFKHELLQTQDFDPLARYARGLLDSQDPAEYSFSGCRGSTPLDLWANIRINHGVQATAQAVDLALLQMNEGGSLVSFEASPTINLARIRANPSGYVMALSPGIGDGHVVVPYRVEDVDATHARIYVYDNNRVYAMANPTRHYVTVDTSQDRYTYVRPDGQTWAGRAMFVYPLSLFTGQHNAIGLWEVGLYIGLFLFGDADARYQNAADGTDWGWNQQGMFRDQMPGVLALNPYGPSGTLSRQVPLIIPDGVSVPEATIQVRGDRYSWQAGSRGTLIQLEVSNNVDGQRDAVQLGVEESAGGRTLRSALFTPHSASVRVAPRLGMTLGERGRAVFRMSNVEGAGEFAALPERRGVSYQNLSGGSRSYTLVAETVDGESEATGTNLYGPFDVPPGAIHTAVINDWPIASEIRSELDVDADGVADEVSIVPGRRCGDSPNAPLADENVNGVPDLCERRIGDLNCDGAVDNGDIDGFVLLLVSPSRYRALFPACLTINGDVNGDGRVDNADIDGFVALLTGG